ncbi:DUF2500 domain-containing protein [Leclercia adecarboxylata]|uniref:DUF2500 domain-containing protein n=1 Tax=Leclercia adecarboxylata TaxID=83655 RepID=UPI00202AB71B|nr:DUF2500 domain-containing protein [Leclercia adecarboxylata]URN99043.1 DUF2500 domain-containing protein [Leclercia adecarboxylata]
MSKMPLFFIIVLAIIVVAASFRFVQQRREKADNDAAPLLQKRVVSNKREKALNDRRSRQQQVTPAGTTMRYEASFKPENGGLEMTFRLEEKQYHQLTVGDKGLLSYKGSRFEGFDPAP